MMPRLAHLSVLLFASGFCSLVYQVVWLREFRYIFGASTAASAAVLAIFMGGLGLGGAVLGRHADRHREPLRFYATLELLVSLTAALSPFILVAARYWYGALGGQSTLGVAGATVVRLLLGTAVMGIPCFLMGGNLPAVVRVVTDATDPSRRRVGLLYGLNTLGAVSGAVLCTFVLLEALGVRSTLWYACLFNACIGLWALRLWHGSRSGGLLSPQMSAQAAKETAADAGEVPHPQRAVPARLVYMAAATVGFSFFLMELVWYRMLAPILGGTTYTFGLILSVVLLGIGLGGIAYPLIFRSRRATLCAFATICGLEALFMLLPYLMGEAFALGAYHTQRMGEAGFGWSVAGWSFLTAVALLPASIMAGLQYPVLISLLGTGRRGVSQQTGYAAAWNTVGAIAGSLAGGFGLMPLLSAPGCWVLAVLVLCLLSGTAFAAAAGGRPGALLRPAVGLGAIVLAALMVDGPGDMWRHGGIGAGRFLPGTATANSLRMKENNLRRVTTWEAEGVESSLAINVNSGVAFVINGKIDGNAVEDADTQIGSALLPALLHPAPERACVIGLGTGCTAGWFGAVPAIRRVDVIELEPAVVHVAHSCAEINHDILNNPKVHFQYNDAREALLTSSRSYDIVFSEPSNPYRAGISSLYTREFYAAVRERLNPGGLFVQWVQGYEVDARTVQVVYATLSREFAHVETWRTRGNDMLLVCSTEPILYSEPLLRKRLAQEPLRSGFRDVWYVNDLEGVLAYYVARPELAAAVAGFADVPINTDDRNVVEYGFARSVGRMRSFRIADVLDTASTAGHHLPRMAEGRIDAALVNEYRHAFGFAGPELQKRLGPAAKNRVEALGLLGAGRYARGLRRWDRTPRERLCPRELCLLALAATATGRDERAESLLQRVKTTYPAAAFCIEAYGHVAKGEWESARKRLVECAQEFGESPWTPSRYKDLFFGLVHDVIEKDPSQAAALYEGLEAPFQVEDRHNQRLATLAVLSKGLSLQTRLAALSRFEPYPIWNEEFLSFRRDTYREADHRLLARAQEDLDEFMAQRSLPFSQLFWRRMDAMERSARTPSQNAQ
jgi:predicted membrane-bound spermidine synthase